MNYRKRLETIKDQLQKKKLEAILVSSVPNITYFTGYSNFSKDEREAFLLITKNKSYIFTDGRYSEVIQKNVTHFALMEISSTLPFKKLLEQLVKKNNLKRIGFEENNLTVSEYHRISSLASFSPFDVSSARTIKEQNEISFIEQACGLGDKAFNHVLKIIRPGISEKDLSFELEYFIKRNGADISFPPIVAFGTNSSVPHHQTGGQKLEHGDIVLLDFGVKINNYCSDMTRTLFFGKTSPRQRKIYNTVLEAQQQALDFLNSCFMIHNSGSKSLNASDVDRVARDYIILKGYPPIPHSLGHGVGLEVHESPRLSPTSKERLTQGMVFSVEPGIYLPAGRQGLPGFGGVRIEDLFAIEKDGLRQLTHASKERTEIA